MIGADQGPANLLIIQNGWLEGPACLLGIEFAVDVLLQLHNLIPGSFELIGRSEEVIVAQFDPLYHYLMETPWMHE